jgi:hypothetical protein
MAVISDVTICNYALSRLGQRAITSFNDGSPSATHCSLIYGTTKDSVLRAHGWNFATKIVTLAEISDETSPGWEYLYSVPSKCLRVLKVFDDNYVVNPKPSPFREILSPTTNVKAIATNVGPAYAEIIYQISEEFFDPIFIEALSYNLAAVLAQPLTGNAKLGLDMLQFYRSKIDEARLINAGEVNMPRVQNSPLLDAR